MKSGCLMLRCLIGFDPYLDFASKERRADAEDQTEEPKDIDHKRDSRAVLIP